MRGCRRKWRGRVTRQGRGQVIGGDPDLPGPTEGAERAECRASHDHRVGTAAAAAAEQAEAGGSR